MVLLHSILSNWLKTHKCIYGYGGLCEVLSGDVYVVEGKYLWRIETSTGCWSPFASNSKIIKWAIKSRQYKRGYKEEAK